MLFSGYVLRNHFGIFVKFSEVFPSIANFRMGNFTQIAKISQNFDLLKLWFQIGKRYLFLPLSSSAYIRHKPSQINLSKNHRVFHLDFLTKFQNQKFSREIETLEMYSCRII